MSFSYSDSTPPPNRPDPKSNRLVDLLLLGAEYLRDKGVEDARIDAERLLAHLLNTDRVGLYMMYDRPLSDEEKAAFRERLRRRANGEPLQYINGHAAFRDLKLDVSPGVLIPRPETEQVIDLAKAGVPKGGYDLAADIGCGSGAIALCLLEEGVAKSVLAVDIANPALTATRKNAEKLGYVVTGSSSNPQTVILKKETAEGEIRTLTIAKIDAFSEQADLPGAPFQLIISNPPYVTESEYAELAVHIRDHEPRGALVSGVDGLDAHRALADLLPRWLEKSGRFFGEIGSMQGEAALSVHSKWGTEVRLHRDLTGHDRFIEATLA